MKSQPLKRERFELRMDEELWNGLKTLTEASRMPMATYIKALLWAHVNDRKKVADKLAAGNVPVKQELLAMQPKKVEGDKPPTNKFETYRQKKRECETAEDWDKLQLEIRNDTSLTDKQVYVLIKHN